MGRNRNNDNNHDTNKANSMSYYLLEVSLFSHWVNNLCALPYLTFTITLWTRRYQPALERLSNLLKTKQIWRVEACVRHKYVWPYCCKYWFSKKLFFFFFNIPFEFSLPSWISRQITFQLQPGTFFLLDVSILHPFLSFFSLNVTSPGIISMTPWKHIAPPLMAFPSLPPWE